MELYLVNVTLIGVGGGGTGPPVGVRCQNFGQFHIFWAILRQNFGRFHSFGQFCVKFLGNFMSIGQVCLVKYSERWTEKPSQEDLFFFLRSPQVGQKRLICQATFKSFSGKTLVPPELF